MKTHEQSTFANKQNITFNIVPTLLYCPLDPLFSVCTCGSKCLIVRACSSTSLCIVRALRMYIKSLIFVSPGLNTCLLSGFPVGASILLQGECISSGYFTKLPSLVHSVLKEKQH